jgi:hypothetical protein
MKKVIAVTIILLLFVAVFAGCSGGGSTTPKMSKVNISVADEGGKAVSGVNLSMGDYSGTTDSSGKYTFNDVKSGSYTVKALKEGYEDVSTDVTVGEGESKTVNLTLKEEVVTEEIKDYSQIKSYKLTFEVKSSSDKGDQKIEILQDDYGKKQHMTVVDLKTGETQFEMYIDGEKAKIRSDDTWMEMPASQVSSISGGFIAIVDTMAVGVRTSYNTSVKTSAGSASYSISRVGSETVNDYPTIKYLMKANVTSEGEQTISQAEIWVISSGSYKNYPTRMVISVTNKGETDTVTFNVSDFGKVVISGI